MLSVGLLLPVILMDCQPMPASELCTALKGWLPHAALLHKNILTFPKRCVPLEAWMLLPGRPGTLRPS